MELNTLFLSLSDHQKLEREARICRLLKHPNIGKHPKIFRALVSVGYSVRDEEAISTSSGCHKMQSSTIAAALQQKELLNLSAIVEEGHEEE